MQMQKSEHSKTHLQPGKATKSRRERFSTSRAHHGRLMYSICIFKLLPCPLICPARIKLRQHLFYNKNGDACDRIECISIKIALPLLLGHKIIMPRHAKPDRVNWLGASFACNKTPSSTIFSSLALAHQLLPQLERCWFFALLVKGAIWHKPFSPQCPKSMDKKNCVAHLLICKLLIPWGRRTNSATQKIDSWKLKCLRDSKDNLELRAARFYFCSPKAIGCVRET